MRSSSPSGRSVLAEGRDISLKSPRRRAAECGYPYRHPAGSPVGGSGQHLQSLSEHRFRLDRSAPPDDSSSRPPRRHRLPPPRPHGPRLDRRHGRDHRRRLLARRASTTPTTTRPARSRRRPSDLTEQRFGGYSGQEIYVVWKDPAGAESPAREQRIDAFFAEAEKVDHIGRARPRSASREDGTIGSTTLPLTVPGWEVAKEDGEKLIAAAEDNSGDGLEIKLGGDPIYAAQESTSPEGLGFLGAAIVLLIAFGSVVAAGLPLVIALVGLGISSGGLIVLLANVVDVPDWTTAVSGLIGIGVGIDYSLLVLTRFRSAMDDGKDRHDAVVEAVTTAGRSVIIAGGTVVIAVLGLVLTGLPYMYGVAISASLAVLVVMLAAVTLLPALLSYLGPKVDRLRIPFLGRGARRPRATASRPPRAGATPSSAGPWTAAIVATAILLALAAPALGMRLGFPDAGNDPPDTMTRQAYDLNTEGFGPGTNGPLVIAAELPDPAAQGRRSTPSRERLRSEPRGRLRRRRRGSTTAGNAAIVTVIPTTSPQDEETEDLVNRLRDDVVPEALGGTGITRRGRRRDARRSRTRASTSRTACRCSSPASSASRSCCCWSPSTRR